MVYLLSFLRIRDGPGNLGGLPHQVIEFNTVLCYLLARECERGFIAFPTK